MGVDEWGKYGARGESQAPACAAFLFRPSLPSHWLQACRVPLGPPAYRASALRQLETDQNTVDKESVETAPLVLDGPCAVHTARLHNHI